jgi:hypothetical protein
MTTDNSISVPKYDPTKGVVAPVEGGNVIVTIDVGGAVLVNGDLGGLRDLARWFLAVSDPEAARGAHVHLDPGTVPLTSESRGLIIGRIS